MMNILENIRFSPDQPHVLHLRRTNSIKYFAVSLGKGAVLKKHTAPVPSTLVVLKGEISFIMSEVTVNLKEFDVYEIPVDVEHEVIGIAIQNLFTVTQEML